MTSEDGADPLIGRCLDDRYTLEARIGAGGMGAVYRGRHLMMGQRVAVKVLRPDLVTDDIAAKRFAREARGAFRIDHPHSVRVFDFGFDTAAELLYLVMEYADGRTLGEELHIDGALSGLRSAHVARQACAALDRAHAIGLVHRDLKPDNIMLVRRDGDPDFVKVLDFGLAKLCDADSNGTALFSKAALTQDGTVFGTPEYMSPEQATGGDLDGRSDIYSLGIVLYEMLTGLPPFQGSTFMAILAKQVREVPVPPTTRRPELDIHPALDALVIRCLAKRRQERPPSAAALAAELAQLEGPLRTYEAQRAGATAAPRIISASETMDLSGSIRSVPESSSAPMTPQPHSPGPLRPEMTTASLRRRARTRVALGIAIASLILGAFISVIILKSTKSTSATSSPSAPSPAIAAAAESRQVAATPAADADAGGHIAGDPPPDVAPNLVTPPREESQQDRTTAPKHKSRSTAATHRSSRRAAVRAHLSAAAAARSAGNTLKEIVELDAALKINPSNREAAYRLGSALVRSGDKVRGCRYLRRARRLSKARTAWSAARCSD